MAKKVICIDAGVRPDADNTFLSFLEEGGTYTVEGDYGYSYYLKEIDGFMPFSKWRIAYAKERFIELSEIDELKCLTHATKK